MDKTSLDLASFRHEYIGEGLHRSDLNPDPIGQFESRFSAAVKA